MNNIRKKFNKYIEDSNQIVCVTCYDASFSKILEDLKIDIVLVGDSLGMVVKGENDTHNVTIDEIIYHTSCVAKNKKSFILMSDMPINSCLNKITALTYAKKLINVSADIVKIEYRNENRSIIEALVSENIPVCGHLGFLPQYALEKKDIRIYGKIQSEHNQILEQAKTLENLGVDIILLECVDKELSQLITKSTNIPVIGIGSGKNCNGQVQVLYDIIGISAKAPKFSKNYLKDSSSIIEAIKKFHDYVKSINK